MSKFGNYREYEEILVFRGKDGENFYIFFDLLFIFDFKIN